MSTRELAVVGGGPVGLSAAIAAACAGLDTVLLDASTHETADDPRVFALAYGARLVLERLGVWGRLAHAHPIRTVHVSQRGAPGQALLDARELDIDALGYVVAHGDLLRALRARVEELGIECRLGALATAIEDHGPVAELRYESDDREATLAARLVVQADGGPLQRSGRAFERSYGQCALIGEVQCARTVPDRAYERFTPSGPIALLPLADRHALIWTVPQADVARLLALPDREFERALVAAYGERLGAVRVSGARQAFALRLRYAYSLGAGRTVLIGNAAQTLHPVAGQGFNLGLRDAYELARALGESARAHEDLTVGLRRYRAQRRVDRTGGTLFTDFLVRAFSNDLPLLGLARGAGLIALDALAPARRFLMRRMIFGATG